MKKKIFSITAAILLTVFLSGCSKTSVEEPDSSEYIPVPTHAAPATEPPTEAPTQPPADSITPQEGIYVYDQSGIFSEEEEAELNEYMSGLYSGYLLNPAVVTIDHLGGAMPYAFVTNLYDTIYSGKGSGIILLINNDTDTDSMYRTGSCNVFITDEEERKAFYLATQDMMSGGYIKAVRRLMTLAEQCPQHVFDNINCLSTDDARRLDSELAACKEEVSLLITSNGTETSNSDICRQYCKRKYPEDNGYMIMIDTVSKSVIIESGKDIPADVKKALDSAKASAEKENYVEAAEAVITVL